MTAGNKGLLWAALSMAAVLVPAGALFGQIRVEMRDGDAVVMDPDGNVIQVVPEEALSSLSPEQLAELRAQVEASGGSIQEPVVEPEDSEAADEASEGADEKPPDTDEGTSAEASESEERPDTVYRSDSPDEPPNPDALKEMALDPEGRIQFKIVGHPWLDVLRWLARISGLSLDWQELPGDYLNLVTQGSYSLDEARDMINRHLLARGYTMLRSDEVLWVVKIEDLDPSMVPRVEPEKLDLRDPHEFVKVCFSLDWMLADQAVEELKPMLSPHGKLTALSTTNRLEAMDSVVNLRELRRFLEDEQSGETQEGLVREFVLEHARAEDVRGQVLALLGMSTESSASAGGSASEQVKQMQKQMQQQMQEMQKQLARQQGNKEGGGAVKGEARVSLIVNTRKNSVVALAPPDKMVIIEQAITALDVGPVGWDSPAGYVNRMQVYRLESIDPAAVVKTLQESGELDPSTQLEVDQENKLIVVRASLLDHATIQLLISKLDGGGRRCHVIQLEKLRAESVAETIGFIMGASRGTEDAEAGSESQIRQALSRYGLSLGSSRNRSSSAEPADAFRLEADVKNNALVLWANEFERKKVEELLDELRKLPPKDGGVCSARTYRLAAIDPEPVVKTLDDMGVLGPHTSLQIDTANRAIIAYASPEDHQTISQLLEELDGSSRKFAVVQLRRLEADYVAGTIKFMMGAGETDEYLSRYDYYPYTDRMRPEPKDSSDAFRVDADVAFNRLLLWANEVELQGVESLLVKLGEMPAVGSGADTVRVLDTGGGEELEALIERLRQTWTAPNQLIVVPPGETGGPIQQPVPDGQTPETASRQEDTTASAAGQPLFRLAQLSRAQIGSEGGEGQTEGEQRVEESEDAEEEAEGPAPPVSITWGPDGRVVIASEDTQMLNTLEDLLTRLAPPRRDYKVFHLKYALAYWVVLNLEDFFEEEGSEEDPLLTYYRYRYGDSDGSAGQDERRLSSRRPLRFISDSDTNTILVQGADPAQLKTVEELITLYDRPEPADTQSLRVMDIFHLRYSKAEVVAEAVKDVYRDLLSSNDRALQSRQDQQQGGPGRSYTYNYSDDGGTAQRIPRWKGLLSIGVDELTNSLIVSAPTYLFTDVSKMILELDRAAEPVSAVRVVKVGGGVNTAELQEKLNTILGQTSAGRGTSGRGGRAGRGQDGQGRPPFPWGGGMRGMGGMGGFGGGGR